MKDYVCNPWTEIIKTFSKFFFSVATAIASFVSIGSIAVIASKGEGAIISGILIPKSITYVSLVVLASGISILFLIISCLTLLLLLLVRK